MSISKDGNVGRRQKNYKLNQTILRPQYVYQPYCQATKRTEEKKISAMITNKPFNHVVKGKQENREIKGK